MAEVRKLTINGEDVVMVALSPREARQVTNVLSKVSRGADVPLYQSTDDCYGFLTTLRQVVNGVNRLDIPNMDIVREDKGDRFTSDN